MQRGLWIAGAWAAWGLLCAQAEAQPKAAWKGSVETLLSRWSEDQGPDRLAQALRVLEERVEDEPGDGEAFLELARVRLALAGRGGRVNASRGRLERANLQAALGAAEKAAGSPRMSLSMPRILPSTSCSSSASTEEPSADRCAWTTCCSYS